jgi:hypothetical protein
MMTEQQQQQGLVSLVVYVINAVHSKQHEHYAYTSPQSNFLFFFSTVYADEPAKHQNSVRGTQNNNMDTSSAPQGKLRKN